MRKTILLYLLVLNSISFANPLANDLKVSANVSAGCHITADDAIFDMNKVFATGWPFSPTPASDTLLANNPRFKLLCSKGIPLHIYVEKNEYNTQGGGINSLKHETKNEYIPYFIGIGSIKGTTSGLLDHFSVSYDPSFNYPNIPSSANTGYQIDVPYYMSLRDVKFIPSHGTYTGSLTFSVIY